MAMSLDSMDGANSQNPSESTYIGFPSYEDMSIEFRKYIGREQWNAFINAAQEFVHVAETDGVLGWHELFMAGHQVGQNKFDIFTPPRAIPCKRVDTKNGPSCDISPPELRDINIVFVIHNHGKKVKPSDADLSWMNNRDPDHTMRILGIYNPTLNRFSISAGQDGYPSEPGEPEIEKVYIPRREFLIEN